MTEAARYTHQPAQSVQVPVPITGGDSVNPRQVHSAMMVFMEEQLGIFGDDQIPSYRWDAALQTLIAEHEGITYVFKRKPEPLPSS